MSHVAARGLGTLVVPSGPSTAASRPSGPAGRPPPLRMSHCSSRALTLLSSVFGACGLLLVGIAVSTDYWLYMEEGTVLPQNQTTEVKMALHAGLWRVCFFAGTDLTCPPVNCPCLAWDPRVFIHSSIPWVPEIQKSVLFLSWRVKFLPGDSISSPLFPGSKNLNAHTISRSLIPVTSWSPWPLRSSSLSSELVSWTVPELNGNKKTTTKLCLPATPETTPSRNPVPPQPPDLTSLGIQESWPIAPPHLGLSLPALSSIQGTLRQLAIGALGLLPTPFCDPLRVVQTMILGLNLTFPSWGLSTVRPAPDCLSKAQEPLIQPCLLIFPSGREKGRCVASEYFLEPEINLVTENTENILSEGRQGVGRVRQQGCRVAARVLGERLGPEKGWGGREGVEA